MICALDVSALFDLYIKKYFVISLYVLLFNYNILNRLPAKTSTSHKMMLLTSEMVMFRISRSWLMGIVIMSLQTEEPACW